MPRTWTRVTPDFVDGCTLKHARRDPCAGAPRAVPHGARPRWGPGSPRPRSGARGGARRLVRLGPSHPPGPEHDRRPADRPALPAALSRGARAGARHPGQRPAPPGLRPAAAQACADRARPVVRDLRRVLGRRGRAAPRPALRRRHAGAGRPRVPDAAPPHRALAPVRARPEARRVRPPGVAAAVVLRPHAHRRPALAADERRRGRALQRRPGRDVPRADRGEAAGGARRDGADGVAADAARPDPARGDRGGRPPDLPLDPRAQPRRAGPPGRPVDEGAGELLRRPRRAGVRARGPRARGVPREERLPARGDARARAQPRGHVRQPAAGRRPGPARRWSGSAAATSWRARPTCRP